MPGPSASGLFVYAKDLDRLSSFYEAVADLRAVHREPSLVVLQAADGVQLLVHAIPEAIARDILIQSPPERRDEVALKFFLTVPRLDAAQAAALPRGGRLFEQECWTGPGFRVCNAMDPEGNVFQLREPTAARPVIRPERDGEQTAIAALVQAAFAGHPHSAGTEAAIVRELRAAGALTLSLVALDEAGAPIGHLAASPVRVAGRDPGWLGLGPIAVAPGRQRQGVGSALIRQALDGLHRLGAAGCVLVGDPAYYGRFGFAPRPGLVYPGLPSELFMALPLSAAALPQGEVRYHPAFSTAA